MALPIDPDRLLAALLAEGCNVKQQPGWATRGRPQAFGPINGVMIHHTGADQQSETYVDGILTQGYAGLPGPLCQVGIAMDGTVHLIAAGRANHAGGGDPTVLAAVRADAAWLMEREAKPRMGNSSAGRVDGNRHYIGAEVMYDGGQSMTAAQEDASVRFAAAVCRIIGGTASSVIGHREHSSDKWDPGKEDMVAFRRKVAARLATGPGGPVAKPAPAKPAQASTTKPSTTIPAPEIEEIDMSKDELQQMLNAHFTRVDDAIQVHRNWGFTGDGKQNRIDVYGKGNGPDGPNPEDDGRRHPWVVFGYTLRHLDVLVRGQVKVLDLLQRIATKVGA